MNTKSVEEMMSWTDVQLIAHVSSPGSSTSAVATEILAHRRSAEALRAAEAGERVAGATERVAKSTRLAAVAALASAFVALVSNVVTIVCLR